MSAEEGVGKRRWSVLSFSHSMPRGGAVFFCFLHFGGGGGGGGGALAPLSCPTLGL